MSFVFDAADEPITYEDLSMMKVDAINSGEKKLIIEFLKEAVGFLEDKIVKAKSKPLI